MNKSSDFYTGKKILVTGAAGSIGSEIVRKVMEHGAEVVRAFDNNETGLFYLQEEIGKDNLRILVGDIKDKERCKRAIEDIDIVFHSAALKHVPLCEYNPFEASKTNVLGTQNMIDAAMDENVEKFITISTDKAVNPVNVMGATKLLAERLTVSANLYKGQRRTLFSCVRFGNVLGSRGSVVLTFKEQVKTGGPVTLTNKDMTRFIMSIFEATSLILKAAEITQGGEIFVLKMPSIRIIDLAEVIIEDLAHKYSYNPEKIEVKVIGNRVGEKLHEELLTDSEALTTFEKDGLLVIIPSSISRQNRYTEQVPIMDKYTSDKAQFLAKENVRRLLVEMGLL